MDTIIVGVICFQPLWYPAYEIFGVCLEYLINKPWLKQHSLKWWWMSRTRIQNHLLSENFHGLFFDRFSISYLQYFFIGWVVDLFFLCGNLKGRFVNKINLVGLENKIRKNPFFNCRGSFSHVHVLGTWVVQLLMNCNYLPKEFIRPVLVCESSWCTSNANILFSCQSLI